MPLLPWEHPGDAVLKTLTDITQYTDYVEKIFKIEDSAPFTTPGHPEIELALVKLYRKTREKRYLELSKYFIDKRGTVEKEIDHKTNFTKVTNLSPCFKFAVLFFYLD